MVTTVSRWGSALRRWLLRAARGTPWGCLPEMQYWREFAPLGEGCSQVKNSLARAVSPMYRMPGKSLF